MDENFKNPKRTRQVGDDAKEREEALITGRLIWESFREKFINTPAKPQDVPGRFIALRDKLAKEVKHKEVLEKMLEMVDAAAIKAHVNFPPSAKAKRAAKREAWVQSAANKPARSAKARGTRPAKPGSRSGSSGAQSGGTDPTAGSGPSRN